MVPGRAVMIRAQIHNMLFCLCNIYAPNQGSDRVHIFHKMKDSLRQCDQSECVVMGGGGGLELHHRFHFRQNRRGTSHSVSTSRCVEVQRSSSQVVHMGKGGGWEHECNDAG